MAQSRAEIVAWVGAQVLPHEADVRAWLRRRLPTVEAVDDVVQEAYCRIAALEDVAHIVNGRAYFFRAASGIVIDQVRRARIVRLETMADMDALEVLDEEPSPERIVSGRRDLARVKALIAMLPDRCRSIFELRRIHDLSQRDVAKRLGITENIVEQQSIRGMKLIMKALSEQGATDVVPLQRRTRYGSGAERKRD